MEWSNGTVYMGMFHDGTRNGEGTIKWIDGSQYKGEW